MRTFPSADSYEAITANGDSSHPQDHAPLLGKPTRPPKVFRSAHMRGLTHPPIRATLEGLPSDMPDVAFTAAAPLEGGPFVTQPSTATTKDGEPRAPPAQRVASSGVAANCVIASVLLSARERTEARP